MSHETRWLEVVVPVDEETRGAVSNFLFEMGSRGLEEGPEAVRAFFGSSVVEEELRVSVEAYLASLRDQGTDVGAADFRRVEAEDWSEGWRRYFKPVRVTNRIVVKPPWEPWESIR